MNINKINGIVGNFSSNQPLPKNSFNSKSDEVSISKGALEKIQWDKAVNIAKTSPEIRPKEVEIAKQNLDSYFKDGQIKDEVADKIADKIIDNLFT